MATDAEDGTVLRYPLTGRASQLVSLTPVEEAALAALQAERRPVPRNREIVQAGRKYDGVFVLIDGVAIRYRVLRDGRRQVLSIILPAISSGSRAAFSRRRCIRSRR